MKSVFIPLFVLFAFLGCSPEDPLDVNPSFVDSKFVNGHFTFVNGTDLFGVPTDHWANQSTISLYYVNHSESGKPQGKVIWDFGGIKREVKAWWRLDEDNQELAIFGARGTASFLDLDDDHFVFDKKWFPVTINSDGNMTFRECMENCVQWEFKRQSNAGTWDGN